MSALRKEVGGEDTQERKEQGCFVYILACGDGTYYTGVAADVERRVARHNAKKGAKYTASRLPVSLALSFPAPDRSAALRAESRVKKLSRADKKRLIDGELPTDPLFEESKK